MTNEPPSSASVATGTGGNEQGGQAGAGGEGTGGSGGDFSTAGVGGSGGIVTGGVGGEAVSDPCDVALFCDDFEDDNPDAEPSAPWTTSTNQAQVMISTERAFSGSQSVQVSTTSGAYKRGYFTLQGEPVFPSAGSEMFGRMMMWLETTPSGSVHWTFIQGEGPSADGSYDAYYRYGGQHEGRLMANYETAGVATDCWDHSETVMPTGQWVCLEWRFLVANNEMQFWLDGEELADIHVVDQGEGCGGQDLGGQWLAPAQFETLHLGWERYQESDERNVWIDDVVVSTMRIGCP